MEKNDLFFMNISDIVQYIYLQDIICDAGKVEIICAIRGDSQLKINVLHDIITSHVFKIKRHC